MSNDPEPTDPTPEEKHKAALKAVIRFSRAGYAGIDRAGRIVDRRLCPTARPVPANSLLGFPKPKPLEGAPPPEEDPEIEDAPPPEPPDLPTHPEGSRFPNPRNHNSRAIHLPVGTVLSMKNGSFTIIEGSRRYAKMKGPMNLLEDGAQIRLSGVVCTIEIKTTRLARIVCPRPHHFTTQPLPPR